MANELRAVPTLNFSAPQPAHCKPGAWLKSASAPTHTKLESTVRYLGIAVEDALAIAEQMET
jgi:hypothetical protein